MYGACCNTLRREKAWSRGYMCVCVCVFLLVIVRFIEKEREDAH